MYLSHYLCYYAQNNLVLYNDWISSLLPKLYAENYFTIINIQSYHQSYKFMCIYIHTHIYIYCFSPEYKKNSINILMQLLLEVYKVKF